MGASYVFMLTAFYVDNGPHLPVWQRLPAAVFWFLPATVGLPLIVHAVRKYQDADRSPAHSPRANSRDDG
jgi:hypothetical protein